MKGAKAPEGVVPEQEGMQEEGREMTQKEQAYVGGLMTMLHSKETSGNVVAMLKSAPPERSIPEAAMMVTEQMNTMLQEKGQKVDVETRLLGGVFVVQDLIEIGNASSSFDQELGEEAFPMLFEITMEQVVQKGLEDGTIDPVELQEKVEPLMRDGQRQAGLTAGEMNDVPAEANQRTAMEAYASGRERAAVDGMATKQAAENRSGMMQQGPPQAQGGQ